MSASCLAGCRYCDQLSLIALGTPEFVQSCKVSKSKLQSIVCLQAELLCANAAAVTCKTLDHLLHHLRRGKGQTMWKCLLDTAQARLALGNASGTITDAEWIALHHCQI